MVPGLNFTSVKKSIMFKLKLTCFNFVLKNFQRNTHFLTLHKVDAVGIKNTLRILFENAVLKECNIEIYIYNKLNDKIINSYFKLLKSRKIHVISMLYPCYIFLFLNLCKSKVSSLFKIYLKYGHLLKKIYIDSS